MLDLRMKKFQSARYKLRKRASTMEHHICGSLFFNKSRRFMLNVVELVCGVDASEVNYDEFMCVCSSCGGLRMIIDLYINFPGNMFEISSKKLVSAILEKLKNIGIYTNRKVTDVEHFKNYVLVTDSSGNRYTAEAVIMAIPWNNVEQINFMPAMPERFRAEPRVAVKSKRVITQFSVSYSKSFWDLLGYSGHFLCSSPFIVGHENRPATFSGYMLHAPAQDGDVRRVVLQQLAKHFGKEMLEPIDYNENSFGLSVTLHKPQIRPWNRIIWSSSSAVGTYYRNLMGGAVDSGLRAAVNALFVVRPQVVGWKDLLDMQEKDLYKSETPSRVKGLLSRLNLYNVTFYSVFVLGLIFLLNLGYQRSS
ncbi:probable flavin-containing monoamine oxidase A isoform X2 [Scaptodrosophila lebanonensis]|nr:probable flavin-containing monoamine oxidase A isoform X2 [Scaptodrosophila lebanonensis]